MKQDTDGDRLLRLHGPFYSEEFFLRNYFTAKSAIAGVCNTGYRVVV